MNRFSSHSRALAFFSACCCLVPHWLLAQAAPNSDSTDTREEPLQLSPFVVEGTEDQGYQAKSTLAGTRIRTELKDVGSAISVVTQKFLQDTNSTNSRDLLVLTPGTEVVGQGGNFAGGTDGSQIGSPYNSPVASTRVRGLTAADNLRDFFLTDIPWDAYNTGRVDLQRGPNSVLFGIGSPAGIINNSTNGAGFSDSNRVEFRFASFGSVRADVDFNKVILENQLAVRVSALDDDTKYKQKPAFNNDHRIFGALRYDPSFINKGGAHTSIRFNYEQGRITGRQPAITPPIDLITPWFTQMGKATLAWQNDINKEGTANPWVGPAGANHVYDQIAETFPNPSSSTPGLTLAENPHNYPVADPSKNDQSNGQYWGIADYASYTQSAQLPGYAIGPYKDKDLTDPKIFDFYNHLLEGPNKGNWDHFRAYNLTGSQTFFDNKVGIEVAYDNQYSKWGYTNFFNDGSANITIDIMSTLIDGSPNPNVGRAMAVAAGTAGSGATQSFRESGRATAYGDLDFKDFLDPKSVWTKLLGRHVFTVSQATQKHSQDSQSWVNEYTDAGYGPDYLGSNGPNTVGNNERDVNVFSYLSGNLSGSSLGNVTIAPITAVQTPQNTSVTQWDTTTQSYQTYDVPLVHPGSSIYTDDTRPYTNATKHKDVIKSTTLVWQGYFAEGDIVPMFGWRKDTAEAYDAGPPAKAAGLVTNYTSPDFRLPTGPDDTSLGGRMYNKNTGQTHTFSLVLHVPDRYMQRLPGGLGFSVFYDQSNNFQPLAGRIDVVGDPIPSPTGRTKEYGFTISALHDKLTLKIGKYKTSVNDATLSTEMSQGWVLGFNEAWGQQFARSTMGKSFGITDASSKYGAGHSLDWQPASTDLVNPADPNSAYTQASIDALYDHEQEVKALWLDPANQIPLKMQSAWGMSDYSTGGGSLTNPLVALTGDTVSKGTEIELTATPISGLDLSINASKTDARRTDLAKSFTDWITERTPFMEGEAGDLRFFEPSGANTARSFWQIMEGGYNLALALNNASVPELRPWRVNTTANYTFQRGALKGASLGGSFRWQDKQVTGFALNSTLDGYDVNHPYYGPADREFDFWVGYEWQFTRKIKWRTQFNVRNAFASNRLIPITVQPDGTGAAYRIPEPRVLSLTNTLTF